MTMNKITREDLKANRDIENAYQTTLIVNGQNLEVSIDPDDVELEKTIELANKIMGNLEFYDANVKQNINRPKGHKK